MENRPSYNPDFENKLYIMRDVEGEPNREELEIVRGLEEYLSDDESFVGIAPFGSVVGGYNIEESDIDLYILYDSFDPSKKVLGWDENLKSKTVQYTSEVLKNKGIFLHPNFQNVNPEFILQGFKKDKSYPIRSMACMTRIVTGRKIESYRDTVRSGIDKLSIPEEKIARRVLNYLIESDIERLDERQKRLPNISKEEHGQIMDKRYDMWAKRIDKIWGINLERE